MDSTAGQILWRYGPPVLLMGFIFYLSAQPDLSSGLSWDRYLRKVGHMAVFGSLALLWWRALRTASPLPAIAITFVYAITDEWHQSFTEGRHGAVTDVLIDTAGAVFAVLIYRWLRASRARWR